MKLRKSKKGFTVVELVIVIAVIAVLAAILIPTFISLDSRAKKASDQSLVRNLNTALTAQEGEADDTPNNTMHDAVLDLEKWGYKLSALVTKSGEDLVWSSKENRFYLSKDKAVPASDPSFWKIQDSFGGETNYSIYAADGFKQTAVAGLQVGFDAGYNTGITSVEYTGSNDVVIRTAGDQTVLTINAPQANVNYYGFSKRIDVTAVKSESLHLYGATNQLKVVAGHVEVENTGIVFELVDNSGTVTNNGYIGEQTSGTAPTGAAVGGAYEINSLARLEGFRDAVNAGNDFYGKTVELTSDITLRDGWKPIGEGNRAVAANNTSAEGTYFRGTFNGRNKTISNLNNKGFTPTVARYDSDKGYAYGLFALVGDGAVIKDVTLKDVNIDTTLYEAKGDSVAALVGYAEGSVAISGINVSGSVKAFDAVAGVLGRVYIPKGQSGVKNVYNVSVTNCTNSASAVDTDTSSGKAAGIIAMAGDQSKGYNELHLTVTGCSNSGEITSHNVKPLDGNAQIVAYLTISDNNGRTSTYTHD